jgi:hypothetical protein
METVVEPRPHDSNVPSFAARPELSANVLTKVMQHPIGFAVEKQSSLIFVVRVGDSMVGPTNVMEIGELCNPAEDTTMAYFPAAVELDVIVVVHFRTSPKRPEYRLRPEKPTPRMSCLVMLNPLIVSQTALEWNRSLQVVTLLTAQEKTPPGPDRDTERSGL